MRRRRRRKRKRRKRKRTRRGKRNKWIEPTGGQGNTQTAARRGKEKSGASETDKKSDRTMHCKSLSLPPPVGMRRVEPPSFYLLHRFPSHVDPQLFRPQKGKIG
jgi:hypothetical protein